MCSGCWMGAGSPKIVNDRTTAAVALIQRVYDFSPTGGNLHCELDDWNLDDCFFETFKPYDPNVPPEQLEAERECFEAFKAMSEDERYSALALEAGYFEAATVDR